MLYLYRYKESEKGILRVIGGRKVVRPVSRIGRLPDEGRFNLLTPGRKSARGFLLEKEPFNLVPRLRIINSWKGAKDE